MYEYGQSRDTTYFFKNNTVDRFQTRIDNCQVRIWNNKDVLNIEIIGRKSGEKLESLLRDIFELLFLGLGGYPRINLIALNGQMVDITKYVGKYNTWRYFIKSNMVVCLIDDNFINEINLQKYRQLQKMPINSLHNLVTENYQHIITNHRIVLLLHNRWSGAR